MARDAAAEAADHEEQRERLVLAALRVANEHGLAELTVRRIAEAAGTSTMSVYSRFGGRAGVLAALYSRGYAMLAEAFAAVPENADPHAYLLDLTLAYRTFALASPPRYAFMLHRPQPEFEPTEDLRASTVQQAFRPMIGAVQAVTGGTPQEAVRSAYWLWCVMHGMVGLELADVLATPIPGWGVSTHDEGAAERMYRTGILVMLTGLGFPPAPA